MPFEPKILNPDDQPESDQPSSLGLPAEPVWDDADELSLPDDLMALAEQLHADANYLHQCHPAGSATMAPRSQPSAPHLRRKLVQATAVLAMAGLLIVAVLWSLPARHHSPQSASNAGAANDWSPIKSNVGSDQAARVDEPVFDVAPLVATLPDGNAKPVNSTSKGEPAQANYPADENPAAFLRDVSSPELDGMLDLLVSDDAGISI